MTNDMLLIAMARLSLRISNEHGPQSKFDALEVEYAALAAQVRPEMVSVQKPNVLDFAAQPKDQSHVE